MTASSLTLSRRRLVAAALALGLLLGVLETLQQIAWYVVREVRSPVQSSLTSVFLPWLLILPFLPLVVYLAERWPMDHGRWLRHLPVHVVATVLLLLVHQLLSAWLISILQPSPPVALVPYWIKLITFRLAVDASVYWTIVGGVHAARATREAREREQAAARLEASLAEARLAALREQLQPHFLFNSLNAVSTLALRGDGHAVTQALSTLSDLLRMTLETRTQELPLAEELAFLDRYLDLQQLRFGDRLTVERRIDDDALDAAVPAMLTQPLVENALRHGIEREPGAGRVVIRVERAGEMVVIEVRDSGPGFAAAAGVHEGIGLTNSRARLAGLYGAAASLQCGDAPGGGGQVRVTLPYRSMHIPTPAPLVPAIP
jgi:two-component system, LytTR family, sensor kinase